MKRSNGSWQRTDSWIENHLTSGHLRVPGKRLVNRISSHDRGENTSEFPASRATPARRRRKSQPTGYLMIDRNGHIPVTGLCRPLIMGDAGSRYAGRVGGQWRMTRAWRHSSHLFKTVFPKARPKRGVQVVCGARGNFLNILITDGFRSCLSGTENYTALEAARLFDSRFAMARRMVASIRAPRRLNGNARNISTAISS
jgi:hypothetical protein